MLTTIRFSIHQCKLFTNTANSFELFFSRRIAQPAILASIHPCIHRRFLTRTRHFLFNPSRPYIGPNFIGHIRSLIFTGCIVATGAHGHVHAEKPRFLFPRVCTTTTKTYFFRRLSREENRKNSRDRRLSAGKAKQSYTYTMRAFCRLENDCSVFAFAGLK